MIPDVRLYFVSADAGSAMAKTATAAAAGGATMIQVRDKNTDVDTICRTARSISERLTKARHVIPVLINDEPGAVSSAHASGVHVGPDDLPPARVRQLLGPEPIIGWSIHHIEQLDDADAVAACDYLAASPVWATPSKTDTTGPLGLSGVAALRKGMPPRLPLVAIGGINEDNADEIIDAGADGIAVISAISAANDPERAARRLRDVVDSALLRKEAP